MALAALVCGWSDRSHALWDCTYQLWGLSQWGILGTLEQLDPRFGPSESLWTIGALKSDETHWWCLMRRRRALDGPHVQGHADIHWGYSPQTALYSLCCCSSVNTALTCTHQSAVRSTDCKLFINLVSVRLMTQVCLARLHQCYRCLKNFLFYLFIFSTVQDS